MNPILIIPCILGGMTGTFLFSLFKVGLVGVASPGSILSIMMMSAMGDHIKILIAMLAAAVTFVTAAPLVKKAANNDSDLQNAAKEMESLKGKKSRISSLFGAKNEKFDFTSVKSIAYACDAGLGSSAMGATVLQKKLNKAGLSNIKVFHIAINDLPAKCEVIIAHKSLMDRVKEKQPDSYHVEIIDYLNAPEYDELVNKIKNIQNL
jgi:PTS system mannitol-specific IIC component